MSKILHKHRDIFVGKSLPGWVQSITVPHGNHRRLAASQAASDTKYGGVYEVPMFMYVNLTSNEAYKVGEQLGKRQQALSRNEWDMLDSGRVYAIEICKDWPRMSFKEKIRVIQHAYGEHPPTIQKGAHDRKVTSFVNKFFNKISVMCSDQNTYDTILSIMCAYNRGGETVVKWKSVGRGKDKLIPTDFVEFVQNLNPTVRDPLLEKASSY